MEFKYHSSNLIKINEHFKKINKHIIYFNFKVSVDTFQINSIPGTTPNFIVEINFHKLINFIKVGKFLSLFKGLPI